ncbi:DNA polymerase III subunit gamma/tau [soil metagenome]
MTTSTLFGFDAEPEQPKTEAAAPIAERPTASLRGQTSSLYRKYRSQSFDESEFVGQTHVVQTLRNAIQLNRVAHAYLFCGPRGTGKTSTARLLAKAVNCLHPDIRNRPCNECTSCLAISSGSTTDVIEIDAASNRGIDDIRDLRDRVKYAPTQLKTKFYIIDEAHQITGAAANAFLKTLEEPPEHTKFVLATTDPEELLQTIVSRCQRFDFRRFTLEQIVSHLERIAIREQLTIEREALIEIARNATGSMRDALGLLDQLAVYQADDGDGGARDIPADAVRALLGVSKNERIESLVEAIAEKNAGKALAIVNDSVDAGDDPRQLNKQLVSYLRTLMFTKAGAGHDADETARTLAGRFHLGDLAELAALFSQVDYRIKHSTYAQLPLEIALVEAATRGETVPAVAAAQPQQSAPPQVDPSYSAVGVTPDQIAAKPPTTRLSDRVRGRGTGIAESPPVAVPTPTRTPPPAPAAVSTTPPLPPVSYSAAPVVAGEISVDMLADLWPQIRGDVKTIDRRVEALLAATDPYDVRGAEIALTTPYPFHCQRLNADKEKGIVTDVISRLVGKPVVITCYLRGQEPPRSGATISAPPTAPSAPAMQAPPPPTDLPEPFPPDDEPAPIRPVLSASASDTEDRIKAAKAIFDADEFGR